MLRIMQIVCSRFLTWQPLLVLRDPISTLDSTLLFLRPLFPFVPFFSVSSYQFFVFLKSTNFVREAHLLMPGAFRKVLRGDRPRLQIQRLFQVFNLPPDHHRVANKPEFLTVVQNVAVVMALGNRSFGRTFVPGHGMGFALTRNRVEVNLSQRIDSLDVDGPRSRLLLHAAKVANASAPQNALPWKLTLSAPLLTERRF